MELETFKITVLPLRDKLINFSLRLMQEKADAEDIVQQAFADVWDKNRAGNVIGNLKAYLYQAVRNRSLSFTSQPVNAEATEQLPDVSCYPNGMA